MHLFDHCIGRQTKKKSSKSLAKECVLLAHFSLCLRSASFVSKGNFFYRCVCCKKRATFKTGYFCYLSIKVKYSTVSKKSNHVKKVCVEGERQLPTTSDDTTFFQDGSIASSWERRKLKVISKKACDFWIFLVHTWLLKLAVKCTRLVCFLVCAF